MVRRGRRNGRLQLRLLWGGPRPVGDVRPVRGRCVPYASPASSAARLWPGRAAGSLEPAPPGAGVRFVAIPVNRLLLVWFAVAFQVLANHESVVKPMYAARCRSPAATSGRRCSSSARGRWSSCPLRRGRAPAGPLAGSAWRHRDPAPGRQRALARDVPLARFGVAAIRIPARGGASSYAYLAADEHRGSVVVPQARKVGYLTTIYTPLRAWYSHYLATRTRRRAFRS